MQVSDCGQASIILIRESRCDNDHGKSLRLRGGKGEVRASSTCFSSAAVQLIIDFSGTLLVCFGAAFAALTQPSPTTAAMGHSIMQSFPLNVVPTAVELDTPGTE